MNSNSESIETGHDEVTEIIEVEEENQRNPELYYH